MKIKMNKQSVYEEERKYHNKRFNGEEDIRASLNKYYVLLEKVNNYINDKIDINIIGKKVLEYGCATGDISVLWAKKGANVTGIDISEQAIYQAKQKAKKENLHINFIVANAENTGLNDKEFDIIIGNGIIHHLDLNNAYRELSRLIKNNGKIILLEPLGHNPFINLYRLLTPAMRTKNEHPLKMKDLKLLNNYFDYINIKYFNLFTLFAVPFRKYTYFDMLYTFLSLFDEFLLNTFPFLKKYFWMVVIELSNPKNKK
jgi:ubiquinone/menaquinone biosynthesis C-methylase UbiE